MEPVKYPRPFGLHQSPVYSPVAVISNQATWVVVGGQNAVNTQGQVVGKGDLTAQCQQVKANLEAALAAAGCSWQDVVRMQVHLVAGQDARQGFAVFGPALGGRASPPLVGVYQVVALANPDFLVEVGLDAVRP